MRAWCEVMDVSCCRRWLTRGQGIGCSVSGRAAVNLVASKSVSRELLRRPEYPAVGSSPGPPILSHRLPRNAQPHSFSRSECCCLRSKHRNRSRCMTAPASRWMGAEQRVLYAGSRAWMDGRFRRRRCPTLCSPVEASLKSGADGRGPKSPVSEVAKMTAAATAAAAAVGPQHQLRQSQITQRASPSNHRDEATKAPRWASIHREHSSHRTQCNINIPVWDTSINTNTNT